MAARSPANPSVAARAGASVARRWSTLASRPVRRPSVVAGRFMPYPRFLAKKSSGSGRAGFPVASVRGGTSESTTLPAETTAPSPFAHEILAAWGYAYLDDAPLEERRARAVQTHRSLLQGVLAARRSHVAPQAGR